MQERELFKGLLKAGGFFLLVKGVYLHSLWASYNLVYQGYHSHNWLAPSVIMLMGIMLWAGSHFLTRFAYGDYDEAWQLSSVLRMGIKMLGLWLIYRQLIMLASIAEYRKMRSVTDVALPGEGTYWVLQFAIVVATLAVGVLFLRIQFKLKSNRGGA